MRILFAGTPDIAVPSLELLAAKSDVVGVLTVPDKASGRGRHVISPPLKLAAERLDVAVFQPATLDSSIRDRIGKLGAELLVVFAYGRFFGPRFLALFPYGAINMHPSALPRYRGPSPLSAAILAGDEHIALTVQRIASEMDAGDILRQTPYPLNGDETTASLTEAVALAAAPEILAVVNQIAEGSETPMPQDHQKATYCQLVNREDAQLDWNESAEMIQRRVRAYIPWPRARTVLKGTTLVILEAAVIPQENSSMELGAIIGVDKSKGILIQTGEGILAVSRLQLASRKPMDFRSFLNGVKLVAGTVLGVHS